ncbi:MAG: hypothetical protein JWM21_847 [Acidobacteria bacterium]|nr:hypothetical protein [Acidobacteriota bacterium]
MLHKTIVACAVLVGAAVTVSLAIRTQRDQHSGSRPEVISAVQLPIDKDVIPVEVRQQRVVLNSSNGVQDYFFTVKNNTNKNIVAFSVDITISGKVNGKESASTTVSTFDSIPHLDIREAHHMKPVLPGEGRDFDSTGMGIMPAQGDVVEVEKIAVRVDYVEFEDKTSLGLDAHGSKIINAMRDGAARYKTWLVQEYVQRGKSISKVAILLQDELLPPELGLLDMHQRQGAKSYRNHMLDVYETHGRMELQKYLDRGSGS